MGRPSSQRLRRTLTLRVLNKPTLIRHRFTSLSRAHTHSITTRARRHNNIRLIMVTRTMNNTRRNIFSFFIRHTNLFLRRFLRDTIRRNFQQIVSVTIIIILALSTRIQRTRVITFSCTITTSRRNIISSIFRFTSVTQPAMATRFRLNLFTSNSTTMTRALTMNFSRVTNR